jgi:hypothetical protein
VVEALGWGFGVCTRRRITFFTLVLSCSFSRPPIPRSNSTTWA